MNKLKNQLIIIKIYTKGNIGPGTIWAIYNNVKDFKENVGYLINKLTKVKEMYPADYLCAEIWNVYSNGFVNLIDDKDFETQTQAGGFDFSQYHCLEKK